MDEAILIPALSIIVTGGCVMKQNSRYHNNLTGKWKIKAYASPDDKVLIDCNVIFDNSRFMIKGEHLVQWLWGKEFRPHIVDQDGTFEIRGSSIKIINENYLDGRWNFGGDFRLFISDNRDKFQKEIRKIPDGTYYFRLEKKDEPIYALLIGKTYE